MRITVLQRGGLSVYGGSYDPRRDLARTERITSQTVRVVFPEALDSVSVGAQTTLIDQPVIDGAAVDFTAVGAGRISVQGFYGDNQPIVTIEFGAGGSEGRIAPTTTLQDYEQIFSDEAGG